MKSYSVPIPATRDPFCNNPPVPIGRDAQGNPRYWITTYNANVGCTGVAINENGDYRVYKLKNYAGGYYSATPENENTLWLCGHLSFVLRLDLRTGAQQPYDTGLPKALVNYGMTLDRETGKIFVLSRVKYDSAGLVFDIRKRRTHKVFKDLRGMRNMCSFEAGDGTWLILSDQSTVIRWNPKNDTAEETVLPKQRVSGGSFLAPPVRDDAGRAYLPGRGWLDPHTLRVRRGGPRPERETTWIGRRGDMVWGTAMHKDDIEVQRWDMRSGKVIDLCTVTDAHYFGLSVTESGKILAVNMFGVFTRHDGQSGMLECSRELPVKAVGRMDCVERIDKYRILGTPYISQRFWEVNLKTGKGEDCGRVAPGVGEILQTCRIRGKIYMAAYTGGELVEYDPARPARFPENPRVVATPPLSMRPVAMTHGASVIWYACNKHYGSLGSVLTRHDTRARVSGFVDEPLPKLQIRGFGVKITPEPALKTQPWLQSDRPWEQGHHAWLTVIRENGKYRCWYWITLSVEAAKQICPEEVRAAPWKAGKQSAIAYAESDDGFAWTKPELDIFRYNGLPTNIVSLPFDTVMRDPKAPPEERYKSFKKIKGDEKCPFWLAGCVSPDGYHWNDLPEPLFRYHHDTHNVPAWDPLLEKYVAYLRVQDRGRAIGRSETDDFRQWPRHRTVLRQGPEDGPSEDFYTSCFTTYPGDPEIRLMFPAVYRHLDDILYIRMAISRDNQYWQWLSREPVVGTGMPPEWDCGAMYACPNLVHLPDGRLALPYSGCQSTHNYNEEFYEGSKSKHFGYAWAIWDDGRLAGIEAGEQGEFFTGNEVCDGDRIEINARTQAGGRIEVALHEPYGWDSKPIEGFDFEQSDPFSGNSRRASLSWNGSCDLHSLAGRKIVLRFRMRSAKLFGYRIAADS